jgi:hypothetical protein
MAVSTKLADVMAMCREAHLRIINEIRCRPDAGSQAAEDQTILNRIDVNVSQDGVFAGWVPPPEVVAFTSKLAAGHLAEVAALQRAREVFIAPVPLARSAIETAARVF